MARLLPPRGGATPFDHRPALWAAFNRYYGTLWTDGVVDQPTKEVGRLRNARKTGCGICKNLRFAGAREADCAWTPDGLLLMAEKDVLYGWKKGQTGWQRLADLAALGLHGVTRIAISPKGDQIAFVTQR